MSEAPERIWVDACEAVNNAPSWIDELRVAHKDSYVNDDLSGQQYVRADIHEARVKELEAVVKKLWRRQDSLGTFDAAVNDILSPLFEIHRIEEPASYGNGKYQDQAD